MRDKDYKVEVDGKLVTLAELKRAYRFWQEYRIDKYTTECPICGTDFDDVGMFVCKECGRLLSEEELCTEHDHYNTCRDCCEECREDTCYWDAVNDEIDRMRGK